MNHIPNVVPIIPTTFAVYKLKSSVLNFPRIPRSAIATDGTIANTKNKMLMIQIADVQEISTCNT